MINIIYILEITLQLKRIEIPRFDQVCVFSVLTISNDASHVNLSFVVLLNTFSKILMKNELWYFISS